MAVADPKNPDTAVRVQAGDTLSAIAKANELAASTEDSFVLQQFSNPVSFKSYPP